MNGVINYFKPSLKGLRKDYVVEACALFACLGKHAPKDYGSS